MEIVKLKPEWLAPHPHWVGPTSDELREFIYFNGFTQAQFAKMIGVNHRTMQSYCFDSAKSSSRQIPYPAWRLAMYELGVLQKSVAIDVKPRITALEQSKA